MYICIYRECGIGRTVNHSLYFLSFVGYSDCWLCYFWFSAFVFVLFLNCFSVVQGKMTTKRKHIKSKQQKTTTQKGARRLWACRNSPQLQTSSKAMVIGPRYFWFFFFYELFLFICFMLYYLLH